MGPIARRLAALGKTGSLRSPPVAGGLGEAGAPGL